MSISLLAEKRIVIGICGSIAAFKAVDLASKLTQAGASVECILTEAASRFVTPLSFRSVTGRPAYESMWDLDDHVRHVKLGETADLLVIAPATAHTLAKMANGLADNLLALTALTARCPIMVAPAMDGGMYEHPATQRNLEVLVERGVTVVGPAEGRMASGLMGVGRMLEPGEIMGHIRWILGRTGPLAGQKIVVTAGPTEEALDPVRFLSNRSTGKQGLALAQACIDAGAEVTLIAGPIQGAAPVGAEFSPVTSAVEMCEAVLETAQTADVLIMAAAVSDFRPANQFEHKIKKTESDQSEMQLSLSRNPDILQAVKEQKEGMIKVERRPRLTVGFAAETRNALDYGRAKLKRKGMDFVAINDVSEDQAGFAADTNRIILLDSEEARIDFPLQSKTDIAESIVAIVAERLLEMGA